MDNDALATECEIFKPALKSMALLQSNVRWAGDAQDHWQPVDKRKERKLGPQTARDRGPRSRDKHVNAKAMQNCFWQYPTVWFPSGSPSSVPTCSGPI